MFCGTHAGTAAGRVPAVGEAATGPPIKQMQRASPDAARSEPRPLAVLTVELVGISARGLDGSAPFGVLREAGIRAKGAPVRRDVRVSPFACIESSNDPIA